MEKKGKGDSMKEEVSKKVIRKEYRPVVQKVAGEGDTNAEAQTKQDQVVAVHSSATIGELPSESRQHMGEKPSNSKGELSLERQKEADSNVATRTSPRSASVSNRFHILGEDISGKDWGELADHEMHIDSLRDKQADHELHIDALRARQADQNAEGDLPDDDRGDDVVHVEGDQGGDFTAVKTKRKFSAKEREELRLQQIAEGNARGTRASSKATQ